MTAQGFKAWKEAMEAHNAKQREADQGPSLTPDQEARINTLLEKIPIKRLVRQIEQEVTGE